MRRVQVIVVAMSLVLGLGLGATARANHCAGCGVSAPACGCDVTHCSDCGPRCGCCCFPPIIPNLLRGIDRALTSLLSCHCRPRCCGAFPDCGCDSGCDSGCSDCWDGYQGHGGHGYDWVDGPHEAAPTHVHPVPTPASMPDHLSNPFNDDPQARHRGSNTRRYSPSAGYSQRRPSGRSSAPRSATRPGTPPPTYRYRTAMVRPTAQPVDQPRAPAAQRQPTLAAKPPVPSQVPSQLAVADEPPRIQRIEYARPIAAPEPPRGAGSLRPVSNVSSRSGGGGVPVNPLR